MINQKVMDLSTAHFHLNPQKRFNFSYKFFQSLNTFLNTQTINVYRQFYFLTGLDISKATRINIPLIHH